MHTLSQLHFCETALRKIDLNLKSKSKQICIGEADSINKEKTRKKQKVKSVVLYDCFYFVLISGEYIIYKRGQNTDNNESTVFINRENTSQRIQSRSCPRKRSVSNKLTLNRMEQNQGLINLKKKN